MELEDLISQVRGDEPLDRLASAMAVKADVDDLTDQLIGHFVDQARAAGCSWSDIGGAMGVTKQAAQQRHTGERRTRKERRIVGVVGPAFARFTGRARSVLREAQSAAVDLRDPAVGTEHLLLGILAVNQSLAAKSLQSMGVTHDSIASKLTPGNEPRERRRRHVPLSSRCHTALEGALAEALRLGHNYVGTEHILLALFRDEECRAATMLTEAGVTKDRVEVDVLERLRAAS
jgi:hypothetical protein